MNNTTKLGNFISEYSVRNRAGDDIPVYSVTNKEGFCRDYFSKDVASQDRSTYKIVPRGCFAYNPSRINVGSVDWQRKEDRVIVSPLYVVFSVSKELDQQYLYYYLKSEKCLYYIKELASGSVRDNLKLSMLKEFTIPNITLEEQRKAVTVLEQTDRLITLQERQMTVLDELVKSRFVEMFGEPATNPMGWMETTVGRECYSIKDGPHVSLPDIGRENGGHPFISVRNIVNHVIDFSTARYISDEDFAIARKKCCPQKGDMLYSKGGTTGIAKLIDVDVEFANWVHLAVLKYDKGKLNGVFFENMLNCDYCYGQSQKLTKGIANRDLVLSAIAQIKIYRPPVELQKRFAAFVSEVDKSKLAVKQGLEKLETLKKSLMQQYFG